ncbi:MAG: TIGR01777 family protein, partial [Verrucomicrobia bacterium]
SGKGGLLRKLLPLFKLGFGGHQGSGEQMISWIDIEDAVRAIDFCIKDFKIEGPVNLVAPEIVSNQYFYKELGKILKRPVWLSPPGWFLKLVLGKEFAQEVLLNDYNAFPKKLLDAGFKFKYPTIEESFTHLLK